MLKFNLTRPKIVVKFFLGLLVLCRGFEILLQLEFILPTPVFSP